MSENLKYIQDLISMFEQKAKNPETFKAVCDKIKENPGKFKFQGTQPANTIDANSVFQKWTENPNPLEGQSNWIQGDFVNGEPHGKLVVVLPFAICLGYFKGCSESNEPIGGLYTIGCENGKVFMEADDDSD